MQLTMQEERARAGFVTMPDGAGIFVGEVRCWLHNGTRPAVSRLAATQEAANALAAWTAEEMGWRVIEGKVWLCRDCKGELP